MRIFEPKKEKVTEGWRKRYNDALHNLYSSPNIARVIKSIRRRSMGYVARTAEMRNEYNILV
jgi:hypothetical protein